MKLVIILLKSIFAVFGLIIIVIIVLLSAESYETITRKIGDEIVRVEIKKVFGKKVFEAALDPSGYYHGFSTSWNIFGGEGVRQHGQYKNGFWHGKWYSYDQNGQVIMIREMEKGKLKKLFLFTDNNFEEVPKDKWPKYVDFKQRKAQRAKEK